MSDKCIEGIHLAYGITAKVCGQNNSAAKRVELWFEFHHPLVGDFGKDTYTISYADAVVSDTKQVTVPTALLTPPVLAVRIKIKQSFDPSNLVMTGSIKLSAKLPDPEWDDPFGTKWVEKPIVRVELKLLP